MPIEIAGGATADVGDTVYYLHENVVAPFVVRHISTVFTRVEDRDAASHLVVVHTDAGLFSPARCHPTRESCAAAALDFLDAEYAPLRAYLSGLLGEEPKPEPKRIPVRGGHVFAGGTAYAVIDDGNYPRLLPFVVRGTALTVPPLRLQHVVIADGYVLDLNLLHPTPESAVREFIDSRPVRLGCALRLPTSATRTTGESEFLAVVRDMLAPKS